MAVTAEVGTIVASPQNDHHNDNDDDRPKNDYVPAIMQQSNDDGANGDPSKEKMYVDALQKALMTLYSTNLE